jgi:hypothetical protein
MTMARANADAEQDVTAWFNKLPKPLVLPCAS